MEIRNKARKVILIDDDPITNMIHIKLFKRECDCEVVAYTQANDVLNLLKSTSGVPDVILLDINMPVVDGWAFLAEFEKLPDNDKRRCRIMVISSSIDRDDETKSKAYPSVHGFFSKPLTKEMIAQSICAV
jgi:CheY-like chemotaxis protein